MGHSAYGFGLLQSGIGAGGSRNRLDEVRQVEAEDQHDDRGHELRYVEKDRVQDLRYPWQAQRVERRHDHDQEQKPKDQEAQNLRGGLLDAAAPERPVDPGPVRQAVKLANSQQTDRDPLGDVAAEPAEKQDDDGEIGRASWR